MIILTTLLFFLYFVFDKYFLVNIVEVIQNTYKTKLNYTNRYKLDLIIYFLYCFKVDELDLKLVNYYNIKVHPTL